MQISYEVFGQNGGESPNMNPPEGWYMDSEWICIQDMENDIPSSSNSTYGITGASGGTMMAGTNSANGNQKLFSGSYSTTGKNNIKISFKQYRAAGAPELIIRWSDNNVDWNTISFTNCADDGYWHQNNNISVSNDASNEATLYFEFSYNGDSGANFLAIDDFEITGDSI